MHFLKNLVQTPILENPAENHINIHRHFYRYSKGDFIGPALKITKTKSKITLKGSFEYEDFIQELVTKTNSENNINIKGILIAGNDVSNLISNLGLNWVLKRSTGKTINYKASVMEEISKEVLLECIEKFRETSYLLLSFNINPTCKVTTKNKIPQPSKKKVEEDDLDKRVQFCNGVMGNNEKFENLIVEFALEDFKNDLPSKWKDIELTNTYKINEIELPKNQKDSVLLRILAIRKGKITRTVNVDGEIIEKQYSIVV